MKKFVTADYEINSPKVAKKRGLCFAVLSDLHGLVFGKNNHVLVDAVRQGKPDAVLVLGDLCVGYENDTLLPAKELMLTLAKEYPVFYALGNHEYKMLLSDEYREVYLEYENSLKAGGVTVLHNEKAVCALAGTTCVFHGLELPIEYYHKPNSPKLKMQTMENLVGKPVEEGFHVLLAHNPKYGKTYLSWGADLTLSGHYHGGVLRLSKNHGLTSPQFLLFPPYCCGDFEKEGCHMIVSAGLGEHTIPLRIHNPRELVFVRVKPA